jgi:muramoyltetrapeptide carboxypeptidase LdcA involved in peptidoglycan recycling
MVVETKNALRPTDWLYRNPEARANDLMEAFSDKSIKAIISNAGGADSIRLLPYINFRTIKDNPKIFLGFSDSTVIHLSCYKAGLTSFYGPSILIGFAENGGIFPYQITDITKTLFHSTPIGVIPKNRDGWTCEKNDFENRNSLKTVQSLQPPTSWRLLQGKGIHEGALIGGCLQVLDSLRATQLWPQNRTWNGAILFLETSGVMIDPFYVLSVIRSFGAIGIFHQISGILLGRPYLNAHWKEYDDILLKVIRDELGEIDLPIITGADFGHTRPVFTIPYGIKAKLNCEEISLEITESATAN